MTETIFKLPRKQPCAIHADTPATWEWTMYQRHEALPVRGPDSKPIHPAPVRTAQGFVCDECFAQCREVLKLTGGKTLLMLVRVR